MRWTPEGVTFLCSNCSEPHNLADDPEDALEVAIVTLEALDYHQGPRHLVEMWTEVLHQLQDMVHGPKPAARVLEFDQAAQDRLTFWFGQRRHLNLPSMR